MGRLLCLLSAAGFGALPIFGVLAYDEGTSVLGLLLVRFAIAAVALWAIVLVRDRRAAAADRPTPPRGPRRARRIALALGAVGYTLQAGLYFVALERMDPAPLSLVFYTYPALVTAAAILLGRERPTPWRIGALGAATGGAALVLLGGGGGSVDAVAMVLALCGACVYTTYILVADGVVEQLDPVRLSALVATGATVTLGLVAAATGDAVVGSAMALVWLTCIALACTVLAVLAFFAGLRRVGASSASILSTLEPVVTVLLAFAVFGDRLEPLQLAGGALVLAAALGVRRDDDAPEAAAVAAAPGAVAAQPA